MLSVTQLALAFGSLATFFFTLQYIPQAVLNCRRRSVRGFSTSGAVIKLLGSCFLAVNAYLLSEPFPVVLYGAFGVVQHCVFVVQFAAFEKDWRYLLALLLPGVPYVVGVYAPLTIPYTSSVKPITQVISHVPQMWLCWRMRSVAGVSLVSQHLNMVGGVAGLLMCALIPPNSYSTYLIYANSCLQALTLYAIGWHFDELFPWQRYYGRSSVTPSAPLQPTSPSTQHAGVSSSGSGGGGAPDDSDKKTVVEV